MKGKVTGSDQLPIDLKFIGDNEKNRWTLNIKFQFQIFINFKNINKNFIVYIYIYTQIQYCLHVYRISYINIYISIYPVYPVYRDNLHQYYPLFLYKSEIFQYSKVEI